LERQDYKTFSCEGRDHQGKGDALNYFLDKLEQEDINVVTASFPIYATPIGNTIREFLKGGGKQFELSPREDLEVKMSLFALNRLEFLEAFLREDIDKGTLVLFDRSAFSNALTIAYAMKEIGDMDEEGVLELIEMAMNLDGLLIEVLNLKACVIQLDTGQENWKSARGEDVDVHEVPEVQKYAHYVYALYEEVVGEGWKTILTQDEEGNWRSRDDIFNDIYEFLVERLGSFRENNGPAERMDVGIKEIMKNIYVGSKVQEDLLEEYVLSIRTNDKSLMYSTSEKVKEQICSTYKRIEFMNGDIKEFLKGVLDRYPNIVKVLSYNLGEEYVSKLEEGLNRE
jgi:thymidylate kinase